MPASRQGKAPKGLYMHDLFANDPKAGGAMVIKMGLPFMQKGIMAWMENFRKYI